jgi:hypothetical protein
MVMECLRPPKHVNGRRNVQPPGKNVIARSLPDINSLNHHPKHVSALKERLDEVGVPAVAYFSAMGSPPPGSENDALFHFLEKHLLK